MLLQKNKATKVPEWQWKAFGLSCPKEEHKFHEVRRWKFDFAYVLSMVAIEIEGGVFTRGRHTRGAGYLADCEKYNMAQEMGWIVLRYAPNKIDFEQIKRVLESRGK
jgi:very-short-patch-repair endonuclease